MTSYAGRCNDRAAIITGGASGLGLTTARRIAAEGGTVALWDIDSQALKAAEEMLGTACLALEVDVADWTSVSASKAGIIGLTKSLGKELATTGVLVNSLAPAVFKSPLLKQMSAQHIDYMLSKIPMGRFGEPDEVTAMICWLASDEMTFSTGAIFDISGGRATY